VPVSIYNNVEGGIGIFLSLNSQLALKEEILEEH